MKIIKILLVYSFSVLLCSAKAQLINIPDPNFEQALISLGKDTDGTLNGHISVADALSVYGLNLNGKFINDLTGISGFINLAQLECDNNNLTNLDLSSLPSLRNLTCKNNNIEFINLKNNIPNNFLLFDVSGNLNLKNICADDADVFPIYLSTPVSTYCEASSQLSYNIVSGVLKHDINNDGCNSLDESLNGIKVTITDQNGKTGSAITSSSGQYMFYVPAGSGTINVTPINPLQEFSTYSNSFSFNSTSQSQTIDYCTPSCYKQINIGTNSLGEWVFNTTIPAGVTPVIENTPVSFWGANPNTQWIGVNPSSTSTHYIFDRTFNITEPGNYFLDIKVAADNMLTLKLDGVTIFTDNDPGINAFFYLHPFTTNLVLSAGNHLLSADVYNYTDYCEFMIDGTLSTSCKQNVFPCQNYTQANLAAGLLAYYTFGEGSINDYSGNGHHLTNLTTAQPTTDRNGNANCAYRFDNLPETNNEFLSTANTAFLNGLSQFSISLWYKAEDITRPLAAYETLIGRDFFGGITCPDRTGQWSIGLFDLRDAVFGRENSVWQTHGADLVANTGSWQHLTVTYNAAGTPNGPTLKLYRNGILQGNPQGTPQTGLSIFCGAPITIQDIGDLFVGKNYTGDLDDILIHNRELTQIEITQIFNLGSSCCNYATVLNNLSTCPGSGNANLYASLNGATYQWQVDNGGGIFSNLTDNINYTGTSTSTLHLINNPTSNYGNRYRCVVDGFYCNSTTLEFKNTWLGSIDNSWETAGNWSCGSVPDAYTDVIINSGTVMISSNSICRSMDINPTANLIVNTGFTLTVTH